MLVILSQDKQYGRTEAAGSLSPALCGSGWESMHPRTPPSHRATTAKVCRACSSPKSTAAIDQGALRHHIWHMRLTEGGDRRVKAGASAEHSRDKGRNWLGPMVMLIAPVLQHECLVQRRVSHDARQAGACGKHQSTKRA
ncbi:hypothetical protein CBOM_05636 [Ceraceosorus bombacis]|uniref:Uncharacterized protein n=1 Tax=Ceraceosorus bombacis TaxID=401625 RepID=A0A0P1BR39_9BASI|nr:hypothetical protein CBOM_05636 [Ceraceosorus bombacis]